MRVARLIQWGNCINDGPSLKCNQTDSIWFFIDSRKVLIRLYIDTGGTLCLAFKKMSMLARMEPVPTFPRRDLGSFKVSLRKRERERERKRLDTQKIAFGQFQLLDFHSLLATVPLSLIRIDRRIFVLFFWGDFPCWPVVFHGAGLYNIFYQETNSWTAEQLTGRGPEFNLFLSLSLFLCRLKAGRPLSLSCLFEQTRADTPTDTLCRLIAFCHSRKKSSGVGVGPALHTLLLG